MFRPQAQAETHSRPGGAPRTSSPTHAETHSRAPGPPRTSSPKREVCCNFATAYFFLFLNRLQAQAQAHSNRVGQPLSLRALCRNLFFFYLFLDYKHKRKPAAAKPRATHNFIDSP